MFGWEVLTDDQIGIACSEEVDTLQIRVECGEKIYEYRLPFSLFVPVPSYVDERQNTVWARELDLRQIDLQLTGPCRERIGKLMIEQLNTLRVKEAFWGQSSHCRAPL